MKEYIYWLQHVWIFTRQKKYSNSNGNMLFLRKTDETIWNPPPSPPLSTNPQFVSSFFMIPPLCSNFKNENPPNFRGKRTLCVVIYILSYSHNNNKKTFKEILSTKFELFEENINSHTSFIFNLGFHSQAMMIHRAAREEIGTPLFLSTTSNRWHFLHFFEVLKLRWLPRIFSYNVCNYQTLTWWDLPFLGISKVSDWFDCLHLLVLFYLSQTSNDLKNLLNYCKQNLLDTRCRPTLGNTLGEILKTGPIFWKK